MDHYDTSRPSHEALTKGSKDNQPDRGDLLINEYIYVQTFAVKEDQRLKFEQALIKYVSYMLNDLGLFFYKATWLCGERVRDNFSNLDGDHRIYVIQFYLFTYDHFAKNTNQREVCESKEFLTTHFEGLFDMDNGFRTRIDFEQMTIFRKPEFQSREMPNGTYWGDVEGLNWGFFKTFIFWWLIVPKVQTDFFDIIYQMYSFDLAHQGWVPKFVHYFTIPGNVTFSMVFLSQFVIVDLVDGPVINAAFIVAAVLSVLYVINGLRYKSATWGISTAICIWMLFTLSQLFYSSFKTPGAPWYNPTTIRTNPIIYMYITSFIESLSHLIVPQLPPYITGFNHWESPLAFFAKARPIYIILSALSAFTFSTFVSYISWPHLIGNMVLYQLFVTGYHETFYEPYKRMVQKACLTGNPALDKVPEDFHDLIHGVPGNSGTPDHPYRVHPIWKLLYFHYKAEGKETDFQKEVPMIKYVKKTA